MPSEMGEKEFKIPAKEFHEFIKKGGVMLVPPVDSAAAPPWADDEYLILSIPRYGVTVNSGKPEDGPSGSITIWDDGPTTVDPISSYVMAGLRMRKDSLISKGAAFPFFYLMHRATALKEDEGEVLKQDLVVALVQESAFPEAKDWLRENSNTFRVFEGVYRKPDGPISYPFMSLINLLSDDVKVYLAQFYLSKSSEGHGALEKVAKAARKLDRVLEELETLPPVQEHLLDALRSLVDREKRVPTWAEVKVEVQRLFSQNGYEDRLSDLRAARDGLGFQWLPKGPAGRPQKRG